MSKFNRNNDNIDDFLQSIFNGYAPKYFNITDEEGNTKTIKFVPKSLQINNDNTNNNIDKLLNSNDKWGLNNSQDTENIWDSIHLSNNKNLNPNKIVETIKEVKEVKKIKEINEVNEVKEVKKKSKNRCQFDDCKTRVHLLGFDCKCGHRFCAKHRYFDIHNCEYDYKTNERKDLKKKNPKVGNDSGLQDRL